MLPVTKITVSHHELLYHLFFQNECENNVIHFENKNRKWIIKKNKEYFTREEILIYTILFDNYIKTANNNGISHISYQDIHKAYRKKTSSLFQVNKETNKKELKTNFRMYAIAISGLTKKSVELSSKAKVEKLKDISIPNQKMVELSNGNAHGFDYHLGKLGELLKKSGRISELLPVSLISLERRQLNMFLYGWYISRYIFINQRKIKKGTLKLGTLTIMRSIPYYNKGVPTSHSLYDEIIISETSKKHRLLNQFFKDIENTLNCFVKENKITEFEMPKLKVKYFIDPECMLTITL